MTFLLDTHALLWWLEGNQRLSPAARAAIEGAGNRILVSAVSGWEIAAKVRIGKLPGVAGLLPRLPEAIAEQGFEPLAVTLDDGLEAGRLPGPHRDPFGRMLIAQALARGMALVSVDTAFDPYGVTRIW